MQQIAFVLVGDLTYIIAIVALARLVPHDAAQIVISSIGAVAGYFAHCAIVLTYWELKFYFARSVLEREALAMNDGGNKLFHALIGAPAFVIVGLLASTFSIILLRKSKATDRVDHNLHHREASDEHEANPYLPPKS